METLKDPQKKSFNNHPDADTRTSRRPFYLLVILFVISIIFLLFRSELKAKDIKDEKKEIQAAVRVTDQGRNPWYKNEKYNQISLKKKKEVPVTQEEITQTLVAGRQSEFDSKVVEEEFAMKLEMLKIENKHHIEMLDLAYAAEKAPLSMKIDLTMFKTNPRTQDLRMNQEQENDSSPSLIKEENHGVNQQEQKEIFLRSGISQEEYLPHIKKKPLSPFEIKAGTFIPAALISGINSDLPSDLTAQVTENIYDSVTGNYLLIPQGTRLIGQYDSRITYGQNRALVIWTRLIYPDGSSLTLNKMQGVDISGYAGFKDKTDNHYLKIYGNALLMSLVGAGYEVMNPGGETEDTQATVAGKIGQQLADVISAQTQKNIDIPPTINIRPGYKFKVLVMKDVILEAS